MKKTTLKLLSFIALSAITTQVKAQWVAPFPGSTDIITNGSTTNVGVRTAIGTGVPFELTVNGDIGYENSRANRSIIGNTDETLNIFSSTTNSNGSGIHLHSSAAPTSNGSIDYIANGAPSVDIAHNLSIFDPVTTNQINALTINKSGNVGIGTTSPVYRLTVNGFLGYEYSSSALNKFIGNSENGLLMYGNTDASNGAWIAIGGNGTPTSGSVAPGGMRFCIGDGYSGSTSNEGYTFMKYNSGAYSPLLAIQKDGKVAIGDAWAHTTPSGYKLYVQTGILTEKLVVTTMGAGNPAWPDYVFESNYNLKSLDDVEEYINKNKHLPEVPSAKEITENGIDIAQMDANLLKKIEELTLYVIQQQKEINALKEKLNK